MHIEVGGRSLDPLHCGIGLTLRHLNCHCAKYACCATTSLLSGIFDRKFVPLWRPLPRGHEYQKQQYQPAIRHTKFRQNPDFKFLSVFQPQSNKQIKNNWSSTTKLLRHGWRRLINIDTKMTLASTIKKLKGQRARPGLTSRGRRRTVKKATLVINHRLRPTHCMMHHIASTTRHRGPWHSTAVYCWRPTSSNVFKLRTQPAT